LGVGLLSSNPRITVKTRDTGGQIIGGRHTFINSPDLPVKPSNNIRLEESFISG
jgi:hypothetical protein